MSSGQASASRQVSRERLRAAAYVLACVLVYALWAQPSSASAQPAPDALPAHAQLTAIQEAVERARFDEAEAHAQRLLARDMLSARERNDTLELLAIAQLAARREASAHATLAELFARDPEHPRRVRDPGPSVEAYFARVRAEARASVAAQLQVSAARDAQHRVLVGVGLGDAHDAVETVHVFSGAATRSEAEPSSYVNELSQVVADVGTRQQLVLTLPALARPEGALLLYVEARAPSGYVLGRDGSREAPLRVQLEPDTRGESGSLRAVPLRRTWWFWTGLAIVAAGLGVTGGLLAQ